MISHPNSYNVDQVSCFSDTVKRNNYFLITTGCSFCNYWPEILNDKLNRILMNCGRSAVGNEYIHYQTIYAVEKILRSGVPAKNISVVVSWSEVNRKDFIINHIDTPEFDLYKDQEYRKKQNIILMGGEVYDDNPITNIRHKIVDEDNPITWSVSGGNMAKGSFWETYYSKFHTEEQHFLNLLNMIHQVQLYLDKVDVDYRMICWQNVFHERKGTRLQVNATQCFNSKNAKLLSEKYKATELFWNLIDLDKFIFYEDDYVSMGGIGEFMARNNIPGDGGYVGEGHPTYKGCLEFVNNLLIPRGNF